MITIPLEWRKWTVLVATIWIQAFTGTNFDFPSYSIQLKSVLEITQVQLNYLSMASDFGKLFGWCSGVLLLYLPAWVVLFMAAFLGLFGYGLQWLLIQRLISLPYLAAFVLCLSAGCSIAWFNTISFVLCIKNFPNNWPLAVSLAVSFNGLTASFYNLIATKTTLLDTNTSYLILNAFLPFVTSIIALYPITQQKDPKTDDKYDIYTFTFLYMIATITGMYLFVLDTPSQNIFVVAILLLLPLASPKMADLAIRSRGGVYNATPGKVSYNLLDINNYEELLEESSNGKILCDESVFGKMIEKDRIMVLGEEHSAKLLVDRFDFWLYYVAYLCGGTIGLVYSNNLGQIAQSFGYVYKTEALVRIYSTCSFFGRLVSAVPDLVGTFYPCEMYTKRYATRTGWLAFSLVPMPVAFLILVLSGNESGLTMATGLIGVSSGFIFSAAVSITSELFGPKSSGINHNILITNIPLGSLLYGVLGGAVYDNHIKTQGSNVCMGQKCYNETFGWWGCFCVLGLASSFLLFLRTKAAYQVYYQRRNWISEDPTSTL
ncbi:hypothetical protein L1887_27668 [Cichorium endivia]|nr:hypothetical protein L1887_27668 [Cichorium endivia]